MLQAFFGLGRTDEATGTAPHHISFAGFFVDLANRVTFADWANYRHFVGRAACGPLIQHDADNLWDHIAGPLHDDRIADADILARNLVFVVQRGIGHNHAADRDGLKLGDGRQGTRAANLDLDVAENSRRLLGREFVRNRPARAS